MTTNLFDLLKLHIRTHLLMYLLPAVFIYLLLIPYQAQIIQTGAASELSEVFDSAQKYTALFVLWYLYLGFRLLTHSAVCELSYSRNTLSKVLWGIWNSLFTGICLFPYFIWLTSTLAGYRINILILLIQCIIWTILLYLLIQLTKSALAGLAISSGYLLMCGMYQVPTHASLLYLRQFPLNPPASADFEWLLSQIFVWSFIFCTLISAIWLKNKKR